METKLKFRQQPKPARECHRDSPQSKVGVEDVANTAGVEHTEAARIRAAIDAAKCMIAHHQSEVRYWQAEIADLESKGNLKT